MIDGAASMVNRDSRSKEDELAMEQIASRLAALYPSDWYERFWRGPHLLYHTGFMLVAAWLLMETHSVMVALIPPLLWQVAVVACPRFLLGRFAHAPRWAHARAQLEPSETHQVNRIVARIGPEFKGAVGPLLPVQTGDRFWIVLKQARIAWKRK
jgi:hypothetical protein